MTQLEKQKLINIQKFLDTYNYTNNTSYELSDYSDKESEQKDYDYIFKDKSSSLKIQHTFATEESSKGSTFIGDWNLLNEKLSPLLEAALREQDLQFAVSLDMKQFSLYKIDAKRYVKEVISTLIKYKERVYQEDYTLLPQTSYLKNFTNSIEVKKIDFPGYVSCKGVNLSGIQNAHLDIVQLLNKVIQRKKSKANSETILLIDFGLDVALCKSELMRNEDILKNLAKKNGYKETWLTGDYVKVAYKI